MACLFGWTRILEVENDAGGSARLVLRLAPEARQQVIELEEANRHKVKGLHVNAGAYRRGEGGIRSKIWYAERDSRITERFVRGTE